MSPTLRCYHTAGSGQDHAFLDALRGTAFEAHAAVRAEAAARHAEATIATTLTLGIAVWPWLYVLQVGDSRCYVYADGALRQVSRDQTVAQDLVDQGVLSASQAAGSPFNNVLSSAMPNQPVEPSWIRRSLAVDATTSPSSSDARCRLSDG